MQLHKIYIIIYEKLKTKANIFTEHYFYEVVVKHISHESQTHVWLVVLLCVFTSWVPCCDISYDFRIKTGGFVFISSCW